MGIRANDFMKKTIFFLMIVFILVIALVYAGGYMEPITRGLADSIYCTINDCTPDNDMYLSIESSLKSDVLFNVSDAEEVIYTLYVRPGRHFVFGGEVT